MSTARTVPETFELTGDDAWETLRATGRMRLLRDAFVRFRYADGFSHARALAFLLSLGLVQGTVAIVGLAASVDSRSLSEGIVTAIRELAPGPAGQVLTQAVAQARDNGESGRYLALVLGLGGSLVAGTSAMGQLERGLNRFYGVERDRRSLAKYARAFTLTLSVGALLSVSFVAVGFGRAVGESFEDAAIADVWAWVRWPVAVVLMSAAMALLFRWSPHRHQPSWSWLLVGASVSIVAWFAVTFAMGWTFHYSRSFGETYGPLAGIVALQLWCLLSSIGLLFGGAVAAQLEAVRAGAPAPRSGALDDSVGPPPPREPARRTATAGTLSA